MSCLSTPDWLRHPLHLPQPAALAAPTCASPGTIGVQRADVPPFTSLTMYSSQGSRTSLITLFEEDTMLAGLGIYGF
jgi:hypothetical protein